ncbi:MAG: hypothetical protein AAGI66_01250 [Cyanobacteria bacterium P01_H01_bin.74]
MVTVYPKNHAANIFKPLAQPLQNTVLPKSQQTLAIQPGFHLYNKNWHLPYDTYTATAAHRAVSSTHSNTVQPLTRGVKQNTELSAIALFAVSALVLASAILLPVLAVVNPKLISALFQPVVQALSNSSFTNAAIGVLKP